MTLLTFQEQLLRSKTPPSILALKSIATKYKTSYFWSWDKKWMIWWSERRFINRKYWPSSNNRERTWRNRKKLLIDQPMNSRRKSKMMTFKRKSLILRKHPLSCKINSSYSQGFSQKYMFKMTQLEKFSISLLQDCSKQPEKSRKKWWMSSRNWWGRLKSSRGSSKGDTPMWSSDMSRVRR
jgi:hypothetical protein